MNRDGWPAHEWQMVIDSAGRPIGKYRVPFQPLREDIEVIRRFLIKVSKQKQGKEQENMGMDTSEKTNMVFLAGKLKFDPKQFDTSIGCLIDVGQKKAIKASIYTGESAKDGAQQLGDKLMRFRKGDFIKTQAMLRVYATKNGDEWGKDQISIDITHIKNDPPQRGQRQQADDDIPY